MASAEQHRISVTDPSQLTKLLRTELGEYMDYQMGLDKLEALLPPEFDVLPTNGPWLEFTKVPESGHSVTAFGAVLSRRGHSNRSRPPSGPRP